MPTVSAFLDQVLPECSGSIAIGHGHGGPDATIFVSSVEAAMAKLPGLFPQDVYFTPAKYIKRRRVAANCAAKRCIVIDIDLNHPTKPSYSTKEEAIAAAYIAIAKLRLPPPSFVVDSGRGLHVYWSLKEDVDPQDWKTATDTLKSAWSATDIKLAADTTRIADLAGYLRLPGSLNTKSQSLCSFYEVNGQHAGTEVPYAFSLFLNLQGAAPASLGLPRTVPRKRMVIDRVGGASASTGVGGGAEDTVIPRPMELKDHCGPLGKLAEGRQDYEAWWGLARLFARSGDEDEGRAAYHDVSRAYAGYSERETDNKYTEALNTSVASPSCSQMRSWSGMKTSACAACPLFQAQGEGGKPAALQAEFIDTAVANVVPATEDDEVLLLSKARQSRTEGTFAPIATLGLVMPKRLFRQPPEDREGLYIDPETGMMMCQVHEEMKVGKNIELVAVQKQVARRPFWVEARISERDPASSGRIYGARIIQVVLRDDEWHARFITVPADELNAGAGTFLTALQRYGLDIDAVDPRTKPFRMLHNLMRRSVNAIETGRAYSKEGAFGWRNVDDAELRSFVIGDRKYIRGQTTVLVEQEPGAHDLNPKVAQRGSLERAKQISTLAMRRGKFPLQFLMLCSLGSPLLHMTNVEGALVLVSGRTGMGKTAAMSYANSFFGSPKPGMLTATGVDTQKSIMHTIGVFSNLPAFIDETTTMRPHEVAMTLMQITQGGENNRLEGSSNRLRARNRWQTIAIASANKSVTEVISSGSYTAEAQQMRAIDLRTSDSSGEVFYNAGSNQFLSEVLQPSHEHYGMLGVAFVKYVLDNYDRVAASVREIELKLRAGDSPLAAKNGDPFRVWRSVAAVAGAAALIGNHLGFWNMNQGFLDKIVGQLSSMAEDLKGRSTVDPTIYVRDFLSVYQSGIAIDARAAPRASSSAIATSTGGERVMSIDGKEPISHTPSRSSVARLTLQEGVDVAVCDISVLSFRRFCKDNEYDFDYIREQLHENGFLISGEGMSQISKGVPLPSLPTTISSVGGEALPGIRTLSVRLKLNSPFVKGQPPEYL